MRCKRMSVWPPRFDSYKLTGMKHTCDRCSIRGCRNIAQGQGVKGGHQGGLHVGRCIVHAAGRCAAGLLHRAVDYCVYCTLLTVDYCVAVGFQLRAALSVLLACTWFCSSMAMSVWIVRMASLCNVCVSTTDGARRCRSHRNAAWCYDQGCCMLHG